MTETDIPRVVRTRPSPADLIFRGSVRTAGLLVLGILGAIGAFLAVRASDALRVTGWSFFTETQWLPDSGRIGVAAVVLGTVTIAAVAIVVAFPLAVGTALYISQYAPRRTKRGLVLLVDLMAAIPSVVYGIWGLFVLQPQLINLVRWLSDALGFIPIFRVDGADPDAAIPALTSYTSSAFIAGVVVALMVLPIACSVTREVFDQTPVGEREAALALGSTRWGMIRTVVLPFGRGGIIGGTMLGLGRALGETIAVVTIIAPVFEIRFEPLANGTNSVSALIALRFGESSPFQLSGLMAAGLLLFAMTLLVNTIAGVIVARSRSGAATEI